MQEGVTLKETIQDSIPGNLELRPNAQSGTSSLSLPNAFNDALRVALKVESPLVQRAVQS